MVRSCVECGKAWSPYEPIKKGNRLLICTKCLREICLNCAKKARLLNIGKIKCKNCGGSLRELTIEELD
ncbi:MAG: hypothetical protein GF364_11325 [Candidatus Lokiarchaeota archaeon]|nr:hypothetical protein [Candidatus Lokiarchaeota archaeon]